MDIQYVQTSYEGAIFVDCIQSTISQYPQRELLFTRELYKVDVWKFVLDMCSSLKLNKIIHSESPYKNQVCDIIMFV